jgi:hypothetical protein
MTVYFPSSLPCFYSSWQSFGNSYQHRKKLLVMFEDPVSILEVPNDVYQVPNNFYQVPTNVYQVPNK